MCASDHFTLICIIVNCWRLFFFDQRKDESFVCPSHSHPIYRSRNDSLILFSIRWDPVRQNTSMLYFSLRIWFLFDHRHVCWRTSMFTVAILTSEYWAIYSIFATDKVDDQTQTKSISSFHAEMHHFYF